MQKRLENNDAQLKTLQDECNYYKGQADLCKKSMMKPLLDEACQIGKFVLELGESGGHTRDTVEKQTDMVNDCWDIIKVLLFLYSCYFLHKTNAQIKIKRPCKLLNLHDKINHILVIDACSCI